MLFANKVKIHWLNNMKNLTAELISGKLSSKLRRMELKILSKQLGIPRLCRVGDQYINYALLHIAKSVSHNHVRFAKSLRSHSLTNCEKYIFNFHKSPMQCARESKCDARQTRIWFPEPSFRKSRRILALPRDTFSRVVRWLTGHAFLRLQNFRADSSVTPMSVCRYCSRRPERADHIMLKCVRSDSVPGT